MKVCFYSPYLPASSLGGGEKHLFDIALVVARKHSVAIAITADAFSSAAAIRSRYEQFLGCDLSHLAFIPTPLRTSASFFTKLWWTKQFDQLFYWTDGSIFFSLAKTNNLHIQIPFTDRKSLLDKLKLYFWQIKNTNSHFTRKVIEGSWGVRVTHVHYPVVDLAEFRTTHQKQKVILHVGRFFRQLHSKRQDVLVEAYAQLCRTHKKLLAGWKLVLVGSPEDPEYVTEVASAIANWRKKLGSGFVVELQHDLAREDLERLYKTASIYWHATGFGTDLAAHPERAEHFGISTIEAMAAGAVPVIINAGGQPEILGDKLGTELLWDSKDQLVAITAGLIGDPDLRERLRDAVLDRVERFDKPAFEKRVWEMFEHH